MNIWHTAVTCARLSGKDLTMAANKDVARLREDYRVAITQYPWVPDMPLDEVQLRVEARHALYFARVCRAIAYLAYRSVR